MVLSHEGPVYFVIHSVYIVSVIRCRLTMIVISIICHGRGPLIAKVSSYDVTEAALCNMVQP
jgi:hypothetical protein